MTSSIDLIELVSLSRAQTVGHWRQICADSSTKTYEYIPCCLWQENRHWSLFRPETRDRFVSRVLPFACIFKVFLNTLGAMHAVQFIPFYPFSPFQNHCNISFKFRGKACNFEGGVRAYLVSSVFNKEIFSRDLSVRGPYRFPRILGLAIHLWSLCWFRINFISTFVIWFLSIYKMRKKFVFEASAQWPNFVNLFYRPLREWKAKPISTGLELRT